MLIIGLYSKLMWNMNLAALCNACCATSWLTGIDVGVAPAVLPIIQLGNVAVVNTLVVNNLVTVNMQTSSPILLQ